MAGSGAAAERGTLRVILPDYQFTTVPCTRGETTVQQVLAQVCEAFDNSSHYALYHRRDGAVQQLADDDRVWRSNDLEPLPVYFELPLVRRRTTHTHPRTRTRTRTRLLGSGLSRRRLVHVGD